MIIPWTVIYLLFSIRGFLAGNDNATVIILTASNSAADNYVVKNVGDPLKLSCHTSQTENNVTWVSPVAARGFYTTAVSGGSIFVIPKLTANDSGEYKCGYCSRNDNCNEDLNNLSVYRVVNILVKRKSCLGFQCSTNVCIPDRYVCDGRRDCANNRDEDAERCGPYPCSDNKLNCSDGRCIPKEWCSVRWDVNCCPIHSEALNDHRFVNYNNFQIVDHKPVHSVPELVETIVQIAEAAALVLFLLAIIKVVIFHFHLNARCLLRRNYGLTDCRAGSLCLAPRVISRMENIELEESARLRNPSESATANAQPVVMDRLLRPPPSYDEVVQSDLGNDLPPPCYSSVCPL